MNCRIHELYNRKRTSPSLNVKYLFMLFVYIFSELLRIYLGIQWRPSEQQTKKFLLRYKNVRGKERVEE